MAMYSRNGDRVQLSGMMLDPWASASDSSSSSSSWDSATDAFDGRRRIRRPARQPGFQRLELHELQEVRQMQAAARRDATATVARGEGRVRTLEPPALTEPYNQARGGAEVVVHQVNWFWSQRFQAVLSAAASLCRVVLLVFLGSTLWIRTKYRELLRAATLKAYADHADPPLISGCDEVACQQYMAAIKASVNKTPTITCTGLSATAGSRDTSSSLLSMQLRTRCSNHLDPLYGDARRRCNEPVKRLSEFATAFRCNVPLPEL